MSLLYNILFTFAKYTFLLYCIFQIYNEWEYL